MDNVNVSENNECFEDKMMCTKLLALWMSCEKEDAKMEYTERDKEFFERSFVTKVLSKKLDAFDIDVHIPSYLYMLISVCSDENPGKAQLILKELLTSIKNRKGAGIEKGYVITVSDFVDCFVESFPITGIPAIAKKYQKMWDEQKKERGNDMRNYPAFSDNKCDTPEYWMEVMA